MDVKRIMKQKGITFETLAAKMGQTKGTLSASIGKDGNPTLKKLETIAQHLDCSVADFFAERNREDYKPSMEKIEHGEAVLELIAIFTKDTRYQEIQEEVKNMVEEGREVSMCVFAERMERRGIEKGEKLGILQVAERMLKGNKPYQEIEMYTGLSVEELKKLAEQ